ncbi:MAG: N-acetylmuramoyl-L-alanine amidase [Verrucomicrobiota bacterium]
MKPKIAICVGHSRTINDHRDGGAVNWSGHTNEWTYNCKLADLIASNLDEAGVDNIVVKNYQGDSYSASMDWLADLMDDEGCTHGVELHFNSAGPLAHGHEVLYWHSSVRGHKLADAIEDHLTDLFSTPSRGGKPLTMSDRGGYGVWRPRQVMAIVEPFFGSSKADWEEVAEHPELLAEAISEGIEDGI